MLFISARTAGRREVLKAKLIELIETSPVGVTLDSGDYSRKQVPGVLAYKLVDALGRRLISSLVADKIGHLGLSWKNPAAHQLSDDVRNLLEKLCPNSVWGSSAWNITSTFERRTKLLTALITEMTDDRQLFIDPDAPFAGPVNENTPREWHLVVTSRQLIDMRQGATA